jgi:hypothetical protein
MNGIHIIGGGTVFHVRPHLAISAVAYGSTAKKIAHECANSFDNQLFKVSLHLTKMANAGMSEIETNEDVKVLLDAICSDPDTKVIFLPVALCDFNGSILENEEPTSSGKIQPRLKSRVGEIKMLLTKSDKLISGIKLQRPDILVIGFKTTSNVPRQETLESSQKLLKESNCDLVFGNDIVQRLNVIVGNNDYKSKFYTNRDLAIKHLIGLIAKIS